MPAEFEAHDGTILSEARDYASRILERDPQLTNPANALLLTALRSGRYPSRDYSVISGDSWRNRKDNGTSLFPRKVMLPGVQFQAAVPRPQLF